MKKKNDFLIIPLCLILIWPMMAAGSAGKEIHYQTQEVIYEAAVKYQIKFKEIVWYKKFLAYLMGYDLLKWQTLIIKEKFIKNPETKSERLFAARLSPVGFPDAALLEKTEDSATGFINIVDYKDLTSDETQLFLRIYNYIYEDSEGEQEWIIPDVLSKKKVPIRCKIIKRKFIGKILIESAGFNQKNKEVFSASLILNPSEKLIESITAKFRAGIEFEASFFQP